MARQDPLVSGNNAFAFDLYHLLSPDSGGNLIFSPYSISLALALAYGGARGNTEAQMADVLHFTLPQDDLRTAFKAFDAHLPRTAKNGGQFQLNIANALWAQEDYAFHQDYLDRMNAAYGAGVQRVDYKSSPEAARQRINAWIEEQTQNRIQNLIQPGLISALTRLILTNAIYFKASWRTQFNERYTEEAPFTLLDGSKVNVPMMVQSEDFAYSANRQMQAISLPYVGDSMAMLILLPRHFEEIEAKLDAEMFTSVLNSLSWTKVALAVPRWEQTSGFSLADQLIALGMRDAFDLKAADFSGMGAEPLSISNVIHKAFVKVDETGTEAAAATAVIMRTLSAMFSSRPIIMQVDRPFIYAIYEQSSGAILFIGRVLNPAS